MSQPISTTQVMRQHVTYHIYCNIPYIKIPHDRMSPDLPQYGCDRISQMIYNTIFL